MDYACVQSIATNSCLQNGFTYFFFNSIYIVLITVYCIVYITQKIDMVEQNYMDGISMGHIENEDFESILNGLDFSIQNLEADRLDEDWDATVYGELLGPIPSETLMSLPPLELTNVDVSFNLA